MKCPKFVAAMLASGMGIDPVEAECDKEECGWWRDDIQMCSVKEISLELMYIQFRLLDIRDKMPHEGQFRK